MKSIHEMDYLFDLISNDYIELIGLYENELQSFNNKRIPIDNTSTIFQIDNSDMFYLGIKQNCGSHNIANNSDSCPENSVLSEAFYIVHMELTYHEIFNFNDSYLKKLFNPKIHTRLFISFKDVFNGYFEENYCNPLSMSYKLLYQYINKIQPSLNLIKSIET